MQALVLAAGKGTRMRSGRPKVLHGIFDIPILAYVLRTLVGLGIRDPKVVVGSGAGEVRKFLAEETRCSAVRPHVILQREQKGTGHAVMMAEKLLRRGQGDVLIWPGDAPLLRKSTLDQFFKAHREAKSEASCLSSLQVDPAGYGRILRAGGRFYGIREELDATASERRIQEVNAGVYLFKTDRLFWALQKIRPGNRKKEFYLTDTIQILSEAGGRVTAFPLASPEEGLGINSQADLAEATQHMNKREIERHQAGGVTFVAPEQTFIAPGVSIGRDTVIYPWTYIETDVKIGRGCRIGPFTKIRKATEIGDRTVIGSFVEVNRSKIGRSVQIKHLAYFGDSRVGDGTNVGAGAITANFDGKTKHNTHIGKRVLVGSNTVFVAPVTIGDGAKTGAGSVVTGGTRVKKGEVVVGIPARPLKKRGK